LDVVLGLLAGKKIQILLSIIPGEIFAEKESPCRQIALINYHRPGFPAKFSPKPDG